MGIDRIGQWEEESSHEPVYNPKWLPRCWLFESSDVTALGFCLWGWIESKVNKTKVDTPEELLLAFWMLLPA